MRRPIADRRGPGNRRGDKVWEHSWFGLCPDHLEREVNRDGSIRWYAGDEVLLLA